MKEKYRFPAYICSLASLLILLSCAHEMNIPRQVAHYYGAYERLTWADSTLPALMPNNRIVDPAGEQIYFGDPDHENHALDCALSPDERWLAVLGRYSIVIISPQNNKIVHRLRLKDHFKMEGVLTVFSGLSWLQKDGTLQLFWSAVEDKKHSMVVQAEWNGKTLHNIRTFAFAAVPPATSALANEVLVRMESGRPVLYVVLNGNNRVEKIDIETGQRIWSTPVSIAPFGIAYAGGKLFVTNWAGSAPDPADSNIAGVPWLSAKVDPETGATREGSVSVIHAATGAAGREIMVGLHPNDIVASADSAHVYVANANSDLVSVIDTATEQVSESISVRLWQERNKYWGDSPNGLGLAIDGRTLYVANGMDNALAVVRLGRKACSAATGEQSRVIGFIPTGAYPGAVCCYRDSLLFVANIEAEGARVHSVSEYGTLAYNAHRMLASISAIPVPDSMRLPALTEQVEQANQLFRLALTEQLPRDGRAPVPVPERIGEASVFKHVVYIIKENRTYDQILGDMKTGDGDSSLCIFGRTVTPNTHKLCKEFSLLDNFHAPGKCSAEGHQWTDASIVTDYIEKAVRGWFRGYSHVQTDALVIAPTGFLWDNAHRHGVSVRIYGEAATPKFAQTPTWSELYQSFLQGETIPFTNVTTIKPVEGLLCPDFHGFDSNEICDLIRAKAFIDELNYYERLPGDQWPELVIMALPNDHTAGMRPEYPTPRAFVAANDLALGQIVEAISKSRFWKDTAIFVTEDDSQGGWDHVSAYRTVGMVISPYSRSGRTNHTHYNQPSMIRTIEQILGLPPMNIQDATAMPMFDCFTSARDTAPYQAVANEIPLDEMNKSTSELRGKALYYAQKSLDPKFDHIDCGEDELLNRIIWFAMQGEAAYPDK